MKNFVTYDKSQQNLKCDIAEKIPLYCKSCIVNDNKKCQKFYKDLFTQNKPGIYRCPYGFYSYYIRNNIYTSIVNKDDVSQVKKNIESKQQKIKQFDQYSLEQLANIVQDYERTIVENIELRDCMHDLRNIGGYFNSMTESISINYKELIEKDDDVKALISLYDLINYRLNVFYGINESDNKCIKAKLYPLFRKLKVMMRYQAKKKKINIKLDFEQENTLILSNNIYLAMFILLENAIKHSISKSEIDVQFEETSTETVVMISNTSPLICEDEYTKIFERGYRGKNCISKGSGIGLSLVKQILDTHKYKYKLDIIPLNKEICIFKMIITFPCSKNY